MLGGVYYLLGRGGVLILMAMVLAVLLSACQSSGGGGSSALTASQGTAGTVPMAVVPVAVADFAVDTASVQEDKSLGGRLLSNGPLSRLRGGGEPQQPLGVRASNLFSETLVAELAKAGVPARRVQPGSPPTTNGWLVRGRFTSIKEGQKGVQTMIGFGAGNPELAVVGEVIDLAAPGRPPVLLIGEEADGRRLPGAVLSMHPAVIAAKAVLSSGSFEREVKNLAEAVAEGIVKQMHTPPAPAG